MKIICETNEEFKRLEKITKRFFSEPCKINGKIEAGYTIDTMTIFGNKKTSIYLKNEELVNVGYMENKLFLYLKDCLVVLTSTVDKPEFEAIIKNDN